MKTTVMAFGRMSPVTSGHAHLVHKVMDVAKEHKADHQIILSHTQDHKKNPLHVDDKVKYAKHFFKGANIVGASKEHPTFLHHAKRLSDSGTEHLVMVAGSDRVKEYHDILHKYNGKEGSHHFKKITVVSAGHRDPDADGVEGMSATKMREHAKNNDFHSFKSGAPKGSEHVVKSMFHKVRRGLKLESFTFDFKEYLAESEQLNEWVGSMHKWKKEIAQTHGEVTYKKTSTPGTSNSNTVARKGDTIVGVYQHHNKMGRVYND